MLTYLSLARYTQLKPQVLLNVLLFAKAVTEAVPLLASIQSICACHIIGY